MVPRTPPHAGTVVASSTPGGDHADHHTLSSPRHRRPPLSSLGMPGDNTVYNQLNIMSLRDGKQLNTTPSVTAHVSSSNRSVSRSPVAVSSQDVFGGDMDDDYDDDHIDSTTPPVGFNDTPHPHAHAAHAASSSRQQQAPQPYLSAAMQQNFIRRLPVQRFGSSTASGSLLLSPVVAAGRRNRPTNELPARPPFISQAPFIRRQKSPSLAPSDGSDSDEAAGPAYDAEFDYVDPVADPEVYTERWIIRKVAAWATSFGFEWDSMMVMFIACAKLALYPVKLLFRLLLASYTLLSRRLEEATFLRVLFTIFIAIVCISLIPPLRRSDDLVDNEPVTFDDAVIELVDEPIAVMLDGHHSSSENAIQRIEQEIKVAMARIDQLAEAQQRDASIVDVAQQLKEESAQLQQNLSMVNSRVDEKLASIDYNQLQQKIVDKIRAILPDLMPAHINVKGDVSVTPAFWKFLNDNIIAQPPAQQVNYQSSSAETGAVITMDEMMSIVGERLADIEKEMSRREEAFKQQLKDKQQFVFEESLVESNMVKMLIREELQKLDHPQSSPIRPDYALRSSGGRVLRYGGMTSRIFVDEYGRRANADSVSTAASVFSWIQMLIWPSWRFPQPPPTANPPEVVIDSQSVAAGRCWAFAGHKGLLTVMLAKPARLTAFTVEHVSREAWPDIDTAPKDIEIWGVSLPPTFRSLLAGTAMRAVQDSNVLQYLHKRFLATLPDTFPHLSRPEGGSHVSDENPARLLAKFAYKADSGPPVQTFAALTGIDTVNDPLIDVIQMRVIANWGNGEFSCVYRLRAH